MAKLTSRQKDNIIAKWATGQYTKSELARKYKVTETTLRRVVGDTPQKHVQLVEKAVEVEVQKSRLKVEEKNAIDIAVKEKTAQERMRDIVMDNTLKISVHTTTASAKKLQDNSKAKDKMEPSELIDHQRLAKLAKETVTVKEEKPAVIENHLNMQQLQMGNDETNIEVTVVDLESEELLKLFKDRNLPT